MNSMLQYIQWRGDLSFADVKPCVVDMLIFSELVHAPFEALNVKGGTLRDLRDEMLGQYEGKKLSSLLQCRRELWQQMEKYRRFAEPELLLFDACTDAVEEVQFGAALFKIGKTGVVAFRGTDGTLVGWKEDLNMSYSDEVPSQVKALHFLQTCYSMMDLFSLEELLLTGHSKGGNLALYCAVCCGAEIKSRIRDIYCFDAPGLCASMLAGEGWRQVEERVHSYIPEASIIGLLLENPGKKVIVKSDSVSILQHNPFFWHVLGTELVQAEDTTWASQRIERTVKEYLQKYTAERRREIVDTLFEIVSASGAQQVRDLPAGLLLHRTEVLRRLGMLREDEKRELLALLPGGKFFFKES